MPKGVYDRKPMSDNHKKAISDKMKGKMPKYLPSNKGRKWSDEARAKISSIVKSKWDSGEIKGGWNKGKRNPNAKINTPGYYAFLEKRRNMRKKTNGGSHTFDQWVQLKLKYNHTCPCCNKSEPEVKLTIDHITPICKGGGDDIDNIQPLCGPCNRKKYTDCTKFDVFGNEVNNSIQLRNGQTENT